MRNKWQKAIRAVRGKFEIGMENTADTLYLF
jgi:hypothetical protein